MDIHGVLIGGENFCEEEEEEGCAIEITKYLKLKSGAEAYAENRMWPSPRAHRVDHNTTVNQYRQKDHHLFILNTMLSTK
jgi:hypothetical protein